MHPATRQIFDEGIKEGRSTMLLQLVEEKFGAVPAKLRGRVAQVTPAELERWVKQFVKARSIDEVFA